MRRFLVVVQVILVVAGLGLGGYVGYRAFSLMGEDETGELQSYLILAVLALVLVAAAAVVKPRDGAESPPAAEFGGAEFGAAPPRVPNQPPFGPPGGYRPAGPPTGPQPMLGGGPHTGPQPPVGGPDNPYGRSEQYPRGS